jgi:DNA-binding protein YbaB
MKGNIGQLMKQAQQMQENMRRMQESLATTKWRASRAPAW